MVAELVNSPTLPHPHHLVELSSTALASSPNAGGSKGWDLFSCLHTLRDGSPVPSPPGSAYCAAAGEVQDLLS